MHSKPASTNKRQRLAAVKRIGKELLKLKARGLAMTALRESRVSAAGWPDFFVSGQSGRILCLAVCMEDGAEGSDGETLLGLEVSSSLTDFAVRLREVQQSWTTAQPECLAAPSLMILCPQWSETSLVRDYPELRLDDVLLAGRESCQHGRLLHALQRAPVSSATEQEVTLLRAFLAPETVLQPPPAPVENRRKARAQQLSLLPQLLDYDQDLCAKMDLWLPDEGRATAENFALRLVTGAAGTGKSVVLVHRAALLRQFHPDARIVVLTHNRALCSDLESRFQRMCGSGGVEFRTFYSWIGKRYPSRHRTIDERERNAYMPPGDFDVQFLKEEFDWIHDQGLEKVDDYLQATRTGRTKALREAPRRIIWEQLEAYRKALDAAGVTDWPLRAYSALEADLRGALYDFILVDEAQFFARTWLRLIRRALQPGGHLFLCADPAQGFLGRGQSWSDAGFKVKGRSMQLKRPYRNTRQILSFAAARYEQYVLDDEEAPRLQETQHSALREGPEPSLITVSSPQEEMAAVVRQTEQLIAGGTPAGHILVLCARRQQVEDLRDRLTRAGHTPAALDANVLERLQSVSLGTLDAATGLERPIVILCGLREFSNREQNPSLSEDERLRHRRLNASRLYMGCTRAMERLVIITCGSG